MSFEQLLSILKNNADEQQYWASQPPTACPNDGTPLKAGPPSQPGILFCPHDGWQYPRDWQEDPV
jgi:hypothetical protein